MTGTWRERITGRWAISWQVIVIGALLTYPQIVLTGGNLGTRQVEPSELPTLMATTAVECLLASAYAVIMMFTAFRNRASMPVSLPLYVFFYVTAGFIYAAGMEISEEMLGVDSIVPWPVRFFFAGLTSLWWGVTVSLLLERRDRFTRQRDALVDDMVASELEVNRRDSLNEALERQLVDQVRGSLAESANALREASSTTSDWAAVADQLVETAQVSVRPLSHRLWESAEREFAKPRFTGVLHEYLRNPRFLPLPTAAFIGIGLVGVSVRGFGASWAPVALVLAAAVLAGILKAFDLLRARFPRVRHLIYAVGFLAAFAWVVAYAIVPAESVHLENEIGALVIGVWSAIIITSMFAASNDLREQVLVSLRSDVVRSHVERAAQSEQLAEVMSDLARRLHGSVQTKLTTCAAAIRKAIATEDQAAIAEAVAQAFAILDLADVDAGTERQLGPALRQTCAAWDGIMSVSLRMDPEVEAAAYQSDLVQVLEEALSNSFRHGAATSVLVDVGRRAGEYDLVIVDNGRGLADNAPGLGTALLERASQGTATLEEADGQTRLSARIMSLVG